MKSLLAKFGALPFIGKALVVAALVLVAFYAVVNPLLNYADTVGAKADRLDTALRRRADLATDDGGDGQFLSAARAAFGRPLMPGEGGLRPEAIYRLVDGVLAGHGVSDRTVTESKARLSGDAARALNSGEIDRLMLTVTFEADAPTVADIVADLERAKEIAAVSRVKIDKGGVRSEAAGDDAVRAQIVAEAWLPASRSSEVTP